MFPETSHTGLPFFVVVLVTTSPADLTAPAASTGVSAAAASCGVACGALAAGFGAIFSAYVFMPKKRVLDYSLDPNQKGDEFLFNALIAPVVFILVFELVLPPPPPGMRTETDRGPSGST